MPRTNTETDFWSRVDRSGGEDACWPWSRARTSRGYGKLFFYGKDFRAHRLAYLLTHDHLPEFVCHSCDNPPCCNPKHLFAGNAIINSRDRAKKNRGYRPTGTLHHNAKVNEEIVLKIRNEYANGKTTQQKLAVKYDLSQPHVGMILRKCAWGHLQSDKK